jgi:hypothetical protein
MFDSNFLSIFKCFGGYTLENSKGNLLKTLLKDFMYLIHSVDSSTQDSWKKAESEHKGKKINTFKLLFWVFVSISISLVLGQLK